MWIVLVNPNLIDFKQNLDCLKVYLGYDDESKWETEYQFGKQRVYILVSLVKGILRKSGKFNTMRFRTPHASWLRL